MPTADDYALAIIAEGQTARTTGADYLQHPIISPRGIQIALATVYVESGFVMYANAGDPDSLNYVHTAISTDANSDGLFQQRAPWWGTVGDRMDAALSAAMFYRDLASMNYNDPNTSPGTFAQNVQQSAFPDRYDQRFNDAVALYNRLTSGGNVPATPTPVGPPPFTETDLTQNNNNCESRAGYAPRLIILHTEEGSMQGSAFEQWMANNNVSYGLIINPDGSVIDMETDDVASWSVLDPSNEFSINICFATSSANWTRQQWLDNMSAGIRSAAYLCVRKGLAFNIPRQILVGKDYPRVVKENGITDHNAITVTQLSPGSTHTDVGPNFPWDVLAGHIAEYEPGASAPVIPPTSGDANDAFIAWYTAASDSDLLRYIVAQLGPGDPAWASKGKTLRDKVFGV